MDVATCATRECSMYRNIILGGSQDKMTLVASLGQSNSTEVGSSMRMAYARPWCSILNGSLLHFAPGGTGSPVIGKRGTGIASGNNLPLSTATMASSRYTMDLVVVVSRSLH